MRFTLSGFPGPGNTLSPLEIVDLARTTERAGLARFGVTDFPFHADCVALMTACLGATSTLEVESLVTTPWARLPDVTADAWATMAELSGGRAILGIGAGTEDPSRVWVPPFGNARPRPLVAVRELVGICRAMWAGAAPPTDGEVLRSSGRPLDFELTGEIPILIAARGPKMLALAGELADIVHIAAPFLGSRYTRSAIDAVAAGTAARDRGAGDYELDLTVPVAVCSDSDRARRLAAVGAAPSVLRMAGADDYVSVGWKAPDELTIAEDVVRGLAERWDMWSGDPIPQDLLESLAGPALDQFAMAGDAREVASRLADLTLEFPEITGIRFKLPPLSGPTSFDDFTEIIEGAGEVASLVEGRVATA